MSYIYIHLYVHIDASVRGSSGDLFECGGFGFVTKTS
jgi:hypothetical protein